MLPLSMKNLELILLGAYEKINHRTSSTNWEFIHKALSVFWFNYKSITDGQQQVKPSLSFMEIILNFVKQMGQNFKAFSIWIRTSV